MQRILLGILLCWSGLVCANDTSELTAIESNAMARAQFYANEIKPMSAFVLAQSAQFNREASQIKPVEPLQTHLKKVSRVLVFLSFSMPEKSLHAWLWQCKQSGATPVIRGLIHNSFQETMTAVQSLAQKTGSGLQLDPILFKTFAILKVPAVVYVKEVPACPATMNCKPVDYDSLYGDVSLDYALEKIRGDKTSSHQTLDEMLARLRGDVK